MPISAGWMCVCASAAAVGDLARDLAARCAAYQFGSGAGEVVDPSEAVEM